MSSVRLTVRLSVTLGSMRSSKHNPMKNFGEKRAWAYQGTAEFFFSAHIISGMAKATNFQFCTHILSIDLNKSPLQISGKVAVGVGLSRNYSGHPYIGCIARSSLR